MGNRQPEAVLNGLRRLTDPHDQLTDGQLLSRFVAERCESAFAALLQRHGSLVYGVCRNILRHEQDAEDAFQGTFLVLAHKAAAIRKQASVGSWLYGVAYRIARTARVAAARRRDRETRAASGPARRRVAATASATA